MTETVPKILLPPGVKVIRSNRCELCKFSDSIPAPTDGSKPDPRLHCHRSPPNITAYIGPGPDMRPTIMTTTAFPLVNDTDWCSEWAQKLQS